MRKTILFVTIALILSVAFTEAHSILFVISPEFSNRKIDLFLSPNFKKELSLQWYLYIYSNSFLKLTLTFLLAVIGLKYSRKVFYITLIYFFYFCVDVFLFWWDYQSNFHLYWAMLIVSIIVIILLFVPIKEKAKIISLD